MAGDGRRAEPAERLPDDVSGLGAESHRQFDEGERLLIRVQGLQALLDPFGAPDRRHTPDVREAVLALELGPHPLPRLPRHRMQAVEAEVGTPLRIAVL